MNFNLTVVMKVDDGLSASPWTAYKMNMSIMPKLSYNVHCTVTVSFCSFIFIVHRDRIIILLYISLYLTINFSLLKGA